ncbi:MAG: hypothetical protein GXY17_05545 [Clostridiaceae bacterium]|jgi:regulatory protein YycI of two-component signal transduction system YycFG|nr:hypothetical protein [Clostridiaceae bacterium]
MLAVINRHKVIFIIMTIIIMVLLAWLFMGNQQTDNIPSRGVFVLDNILPQDMQGGGI